MNLYTLSLRRGRERLYLVTMVLIVSIYVMNRSINYYSFYGKADMMNDSLPWKNAEDDENIHSRGTGGYIPVAQKEYVSRIMNRNQGYTNEHVKFDGIGEMDYLRGESPKDAAQTKSIYNGFVDQFQQALIPQNNINNEIPSIIQSPPREFESNIGPVQNNPNINSESITTKASPPPPPTTTTTTKNAGVSSSPFQTCMTPNTKEGNGIKNRWLVLGTNGHDLYETICSHLLQGQNNPKQISITYYPKDWILYENEDNKNQSVFDPSTSIITSDAESMFYMCQLARHVKQQPQKTLPSWIVHLPETKQNVMSEIGSILMSESEETFQLYENNQRPVFILQTEKVFLKDKKDDNSDAAGLSREELSIQRFAMLTNAKHNVPMSDILKIVTS